MVDDNPSDDPCLGCWILDGTSVFKTDGDLNETYEISSLSDPNLVCVNHSNRGCYVVDDSLGLLSFDSVGDLIGSGSFTDPSVIGAFSNSEGDLYVLTEDDLYKFINVDGNITLSVTFNLSSYLTSQMAIGCFDIDTGTDYIYTTFTQGAETTQQ
jgi:phage tail sheath gpL-like